MARVLHISGASEQLMKRYAAKLMFQFRVVVDGDPGKRRLCEERIILVDAMSATPALRKAKRSGKKSQFTYRNSDGSLVHFEFVGVMDLIELGIECSHGEVWYDIVERIQPSERKSKFIPPDSELNAIKFEAESKKPRKAR